MAFETDKLCIGDMLTVAEVVFLQSLYTTGGATGAWHDVSGTIDGVNKVFTLPTTPLVAGACLLFLARQPQAITVDYTLSGTTITYTVAPDISLSGQPHKAFY